MARSANANSVIGLEANSGGAARKPSLERGIAGIQSYTLRLGGPLLGALIGSQGGRSDSGLTAGLVVGARLAALIDDLLLAYEVVGLRGVQPLVEVGAEQSAAGLAWSF